MPISLSGSLVLTGSLTTTSTITAQTLVVQTITSSISSITGSTNFGTLSSNTHTFTGSLNVTGALYVTTGNVGIGTTSPSQKLEVVGGEIKAGRVDTGNEGGQVSFGRASDNNTTWYIDAYGSSTSPQLRFVDVDNAAVRMVLTGSNVGIGTTSPSSLLDLSIGNNQKIFNMKGATTGYQYMQMSNTSGNLLIGIEGSTPNNIATGDLAYSSVICTANTSALQFGVNQAVSMTLVNGGNVGIGTSSPSSILVLNQSNSASSTALQIINSSNASTTTKTAELLFQISDTGNTPKQVANIIAYPDGVNVLSGGLTFGTRSGDSNPPVERMRITSTGEIYFSSTAGAILFTRPSSGAYHRFLYSGASSNVMYSGGTAIGFNNFADSIRIFNVLDNGNYSFSGSNISDVRLKSNITPITMNATEKICKLESVSYVMTDNETQIRYGFIAQEVAKILPDLISGEESEGYIGLDYNGILTVAVKAIQELKAENDSLKSRIEILENK